MPADIETIEPEQEPLLQDGQRCLVFGSTGYSGIDSVDWNVGTLPNIVDYDAIVVDVQSLTVDLLSVIPLDRFREIRRQLTRFLHSNGLIVVVSDSKRIHEEGTNYVSRRGNYDWCPIEIGISDESGRSLVVTDNQRFARYLSCVEAWPYYFFVPQGCLSHELTDFYGPTHNTEYKVPIRSYVENRYGKTVAGAIVCEVRHERNRSAAYNTYKEYPEAPDTVTGEIVLLPLIESLEHKEAVRLVLEELTGTPMTHAPPDWVGSITVPGVQELEDSVLARQQQIAQLMNEVSQLEESVQAKESVRRIIYASGVDLEEAVRECLESLGGKVTPARYGQEEYVLEYKNEEFLIEVKGVSKSASLTHLRQLNDYILRYQEDTGKACKGILVANAWRNTPLEDRGPPDKPVFPDNVVSRAEEWNISLVSSSSFLEAYFRFIEGAKEAGEILDQIVSSNGVVNFG